MRKMTTFTPLELDRLQIIVKPIVAALWPTCRGRRRLQFSMDVLFITLTAYKNGSAWDFRASFFKIKSCTFQQIITKFFEIVMDGLYD